jgi:beta-lactamase regulating signal transducer with metallopeptidase domain
MTGAVPATWTAVLGWTLIHFLWQGTAIALALAIALAVVPRRAARIRYAAGCFALLLMLIVPAVTAWQLADPSEPASPFFEPVRAAAVVPDSLGGGLPGDSPLIETRRSERSEVATTFSSVERARLDPSALMPWIVAAWTFGVLICSVRLGGGWWQARRLVTMGTRPVTERWDRVKAELAVRLELSRPVRLLESSRVAVPIVVGWLKPTLLVPTAVLGGMHPQEPCSRTSWRTSGAMTTS